MKWNQNCGHAIGALLLIVGILVPATQAQIVYVDQDATGNNDGSDWTHAYVDLQDGLDDARNDPGVIQIWVAEGTYLPDGANPGDRTISFELVPHVALYGGFNGTEQQESDRDPATNITILSGDLNGDDDGGFTSDNAQTVVTFVGNATQNARIDGFTITGGFNDGNELGGGVFFFASIRAPVIQNCTITDNHAAQRGGGVCVNAPNFNLLDSTIVGNEAVSGVNGRGGGLCCFKPAEIRNCVFEDNFAVRFGGGMDLAAGGAVISTIFKSNVMDEFGGGLYSGGPTTLINCVFQNNGSSFVFSAGGGAVLTGQGDEVLNCAFIGNHADRWGGALYFAELVDWKVINCAIVSNATNDDEGAGVHWGFENPELDPGPLVANSILWNNTADADGTPTMNEAAQLKLGLPSGSVKFCDLQDANSYKTPDVLDVDPDFVDQAAGDLRLLSTSQLIDNGANSLAPVDSEDVDDDGCLTEKTPDLDRSFRVNYTTVDMGAYEFICDGDVNEDGAVDVYDLFDLLAAWGACPAGCAECRSNLNNQTNSQDAVDVFDLFVLLGNWGGCSGTGGGGSIPQTVSDCLNMFDPDTEMEALQKCLQAVQGEL